MLLVSTLAFLKGDKEQTSPHNPLIDFMGALSNNPEYDIDRSEQRLRPVSELQYENGIAEQYKAFIADLVKTDPTAKDMGLCPDCFAKKGLPVIHRMHLGNDSQELGHWDNMGNMYIRANSPEAMAYTARHEEAHAVLNFGDEQAELYAQVNLKTGYEPDGVYPIAERSDWAYGSAQIRQIWLQAKKAGGEQAFWKAMQTGFGVKEMWEKYSPKLKDGSLLMSYKQWQDIRSMSGNNVLLKFCNALEYGEVTGRNLDKDLEKLSRDFELAYNPKYLNNPKYIETVQRQINGFSDFVTEYNVPRVPVTARPITRVNDVFHENADCLDCKGEK
jgi:hypothetical protein